MVTVKPIQAQHCGQLPSQALTRTSCAMPCQNKLIHDRLPVSEPASLSGWAAVCVRSQMERSGGNDWLPVRSKPPACTVKDLVARRMLAMVLRTFVLTLASAPSGRPWLVTELSLLATPCLVRDASRLHARALLLPPSASLVDGLGFWLPNMAGL